MIGKALKFVRTEKRLKQSDLCKILNIGQSTLSDYENEKISINFEMIEKIANICDYEIYFENKINKKKFKVKDIERKVD